MTEQVPAADPELALKAEFDARADDEIHVAPMPTRGLLKRRKNVLYQLIRLAALNVRMIRVIGSSHHG